MSPSRNSRLLIEFAESIELYAHQNRIVIRLEMDDYEAARLLCRHAVAQCTEIAEALPSGQMREEHEENARRIRLLETMIAEAELHAGCAGQVTSTSF